ncbi:uncharacterized protein METZ01_LOCUS505111, partial [marine metagenome]
TEGTPGGAPETETPVSRITDDMSEDLKKSIISVEQFSITTEDDIELQGPAAVIYNQLDEGEDLKEVRKRIRELTQFFPEEKENMNSVLLDFQDKLIDELTSSEVTTTPMSLEEEIQGTLTAEQIGEKLAKKGRASATAGFGTAWNARKDYERRQRLEWRLTGERSVGDYQFARDLKNAGLSENASSKDIRAYLYGEEEDTLVAAE